MRCSREAAWCSAQRIKISMIAGGNHTLIDTQVRIRRSAKVIAHCTAPLISQKSEIFDSFPPGGSLSGAPAPRQPPKINDHLSQRSSNPSGRFGRRGAILYQNAVAVVDLVLDDLGCPALEILDPGLEILRLPTDLDLLPAPAFPGPAQQRETAFLRFVGAFDL